MHSKPWRRYQETTQLSFPRSHSNKQENKEKETEEVRKGNHSSIFHNNLNNKENESIECHECQHLEKKTMKKYQNLT